MTYLTKTYDSESTLQTATCKALRDVGALCYKFASPSKRGVPDVLVLGENMTCMFIEFKNPNGKGRLSRLQQLEIAKLEDNGHITFIVDSTESANEAISFFKLTLQGHN